jgi:capsular polysaccharide export protein
VVVGSFAGNAPSHARLLIKLHPLDPGFKSWDKIISEIASKAGVGDRVSFIDGGAFEGLLPRCAGVVAVNSTAGIAALQAGCPVKTLGEAVYNIRGLVNECNLDEFWNSPCKPDPQLVADFVRALAGCIQIKGGFFSKAGLENAIDGAMQRLLARKVNDPFRQLVDESRIPMRSKPKDKAGERIRRARAIVRGRS